MAFLTDFLSNMDWEALINLLIRLVAVLCCLVIHECCHGLVAYWLGDSTAKDQKRLSLNPFRHIDVFGTLMMVLVGFGWAKPVPVNMNQFKHPKSGMALTALAGPVSNFVLSYLSLVAGYFCLGIMLSSGTLDSAFGNGLMNFFVVLSELSLGLGVFNLIPFPPLDGFKIIGVLIPNKVYYWLLRYEFAGTIILFVLLFFGVLDTPLTAARSWLMNAIDSIANWPIYLFVH